MAYVREHEFLPQTFIIIAVPIFDIYKILMNNTLINYTFVFPNKFPTENISLFQGFHPGMLDEVFLQALRKIILNTPVSVFEIFLSQDKLVNLRREAIPKITRFINEDDYFSSDLYKMELESYAINVVILLKGLKYIPEIINEFAIKPICLSDEWLDADMKLSDVNSIFSLDKLLYSIIGSLLSSDKISSEDKTILSEFSSRPLRDRSTYSAYINQPMQSAVIPNIACLVNLGFNLDAEDIVFYNKQDSVDEALEKAHNKIVEAIILSSANLNKIWSNGLVENKLNNAIVYCPAIMASYYNTYNPGWKRILREIKSSSKKELIKNHFIKNKGYSITVLNTDGKHDLFEEDENRLFEYIAYIRSAELFFTTWLISTLVVSGFCPAIRLPHSIMLYRYFLSEIELHSKRDHIKSKLQIQKLFSRYSEIIIKLVGNDLIREIYNYDQLILCCDLPLEWVSFRGGLPLMFTHEISKIPMTPGSLFQRIVRDNTTRILNKSDFSKILIIRSYKKLDEVASILESKLTQGDMFKPNLNFKGYKNVKNCLKITIIDVNSKAELVHALNDFVGYLVIFDCHGNHGGIEEPGWLQIGDEKVITIGLNKEAKIPPIIIMSSCLTHAVGGSESSVANGLLDSGAVSVLGTFLPVDAEESAVFIARLLLAVNALINGHLKSATWRTVLSTFFRMSYTTDILRKFLTNKDISEIDFAKINLQINTLILSKEEKWFDVLCDSLARLTNSQTEETMKKILSNFMFVETMCYTQLGRPELLVFTS
jgi:hypothetical protein